MALQALPLLLVTLAALTDLLWQKVPNWLTFPAVIGGLLVHTTLNGVDGLLFSSAGLAAGFGLLIFFYALGGMAAGDVKLLAAVGAWLGAQLILAVFLISTIAGGVYALVLWLSLAIARSGVRDTWRHIVETTRAVALTGQLNVLVPEPDASRPKLRYAVCIALGTLVAQLRAEGYVTAAFAGLA